MLQNTRKMRTSRARLPKKLTFEPGDYVSRRYADGRTCIYIYYYYYYYYYTDSACSSVH